jgi:DNA-binding transcriptional LysR family regulator
MEVFVRAGDCGSFSGVAKQRRIGQRAVSKTVAQLEGRLGVRLAHPTMSEGLDPLLSTVPARSGA